jgi:kynureninase
MPDTSQTIRDAVESMGEQALTEELIVEHIHPLFSRVLERNEKTDEIYLANHSLGRPLDALADHVSYALDAWYNDLDGAWELWMGMRDQYRTLVAKILGCSRWDCVVPKSSAGQGLRAVLNALPTTCPNIVATRGEFDSIDFHLKAYAHKERANINWVEPDSCGLYSTDNIINSITDETDLIVCSMVCFVTGQVIDGLDRIISAAHKHNALVVLDTYHAYGTIPMSFDELGCDFAIGGNYKYTRGGAGACFLAIHPRHLSETGGVPNPNELFSIDTGWFAKLDTFSYKRTELPEYESGGDAWLESTPPILTYAQAIPGLVLTESIGVQRLREYSHLQQAFLADELNKHEIKPWLIDEHGAYILIEVEDAGSAIQQLKNAGVNADARPVHVHVPNDPDSSHDNHSKSVVRLCPDLLNTRAELANASDRIAKALAPRS